MNCNRLIVAFAAALLLGASARAYPPNTITDESKVPPYTLPDPLLCQDGTRVTDAKTWAQRRRPELLRMFANEVYGKTPIGRPAGLRFVVRELKNDARGGKATRLRVGVLFEGRDDGRQMELLIYLPNQAHGPVPLFVGLNFDGNYATTDEKDIPLPKYWVMRHLPGKSPLHSAAEAGRGIDKEAWQYDLALAHGYGVATVAYGEVEPDADGHWKDGPRGLGPAPKPGDWGSLGAWAWALSRALDYLESNPRVDARRIIVLGHSRLGKTALWAAAQDERFAMAVSLHSGAGGAALSKRIFGETVAHLEHNFSRWFSANFARYADNEAALPLDQHELAALIAPRPLLVVSATDDLWADPKGEFLGAAGADPVYRLLGTDGIAQRQWPEPGKLLTSRIGYYLRPGKHEVTREEWEAMIAFADRHLGNPAATAPAPAPAAGAAAPGPAPQTEGHASRPFLLDKHYLCLPVQDTNRPRNGRAAMRKMSLLVDGRAVRQWEMELADAAPDWWAALDVSPWQGQAALLVVDTLPQGSLGLKSVVLSDSRLGLQNAYHETLRPQFHFTPRRGWTNDPNGLLWYQGQYHLFFQHNPYGVKWGNMHWGHAVSKDLVHWTELDPAVYPDELGVCFSGSGVVDHANTTGFKTGAADPLVLIFTSMGRQHDVQSLAYSVDGGHAWQKFARNPVIDPLVPGNRDPKVIWYAPGKKWVLALYLPAQKGQSDAVYALFGSPDLKTWTKLCEIPPPQCGECPDLFELPVDGNPQNTRWIFWGGSGNYWVGHFDGQNFRIDSGIQSFHAGAFYYAAQTFSDIHASDGRRIQIAWMSGGQYPGMPFSQQMSFPRELTLHTTADGIRMFCTPVREIELLHAREIDRSGAGLSAGANPLAGLHGELFDIRAEIELGTAAAVGFNLRGLKVRYDAKAKTLACAEVSTALAPIAGRIKLQLLLDRTSLEIFAADGRTNLNHCFVPDAADTSLAVYAEGGEAKLVSLKVYPLRSAWQ